MSSRPSLFSLVQCQSWGDKSVLLKRPAGQLLKAEGAERMLSLSARCSWGKRFKRNRGEPLKAHLGLILHKDLPSRWMFHRSAWESAEEGLDSIKAFHSWRVIINSEEDLDFFFNTSVELFLKVLIRATFITRTQSFGLLQSCSVVNVRPQERTPNDIRRSLRFFQNDSRLSRRSETRRVVWLHHDAFTDKHHCKRNVRVEFRQLK